MTNKRQHWTPSPSLSTSCRSSLITLTVQVLPRREVLQCITKHPSTTVYPVAHCPVSPSQGTFHYKLIIIDFRLTKRTPPLYFLRIVKGDNITKLRLLAASDDPRGASAAARQSSRCRATGA
ncbi:hypothetical protein O3P69_010191 [Scylla paramamosain]|uniref:Uncharacterized protein n=1 Tax=Scylla paramamosain TaxID=85552 RepID=A0AAW0TSH9_SCYPA